MRCLEKCIFDIDHGCEHFCLAEKWQCIQGSETLARDVYCYLETRYSPKFSGLTHKFLFITTLSLPLSLPFSISLPPLRSKMQHQCNTIALTRKGRPVSPPHHMRASLNILPSTTLESKKNNNLPPTVPPQPQRLPQLLRLILLLLAPHIPLPVIPLQRLVNRSPPLALRTLIHK